MRLCVLLLITMVVACGDDGSASSSAATNDTTGASEASTAASSAPTTSDSSATGTASGTSTAGTTDAETTDDTIGATTGDTTGPILLYFGPPGDAVVPGWDPADPRPILVYQYGFGNAWTGATATIHPDGTIDNAATLISVWGFEIPQIYDGVHFGGTLPGYDPVSPGPVIALGTGPTLGDDWLTMTPGLWVDYNSGFVAPGSIVERLVVWNFDGVEDPPTSQYAGPNDATYVVPNWDPDAPSPMIVWWDTVIDGQWKEGPYPVFDDGTTDPDVMSSIIIYGW